MRNSGSSKYGANKQYKLTTNRHHLNSTNPDHASNVLWIWPMLLTVKFLSHLWPTINNTIIIIMCYYHIIKYTHKQSTNKIVTSKLIHMHTSFVFHDCSVRAHISESNAGTRTPPLGCWIAVAGVVVHVLWLPSPRSYARSADGSPE